MNTGHQHPGPRACKPTAIRSILTLCMTLCLVVITSCAQEKPPSELVTPDQAPNPLPNYLHGTIRYEADLIGYNPTLVQGYGLVVGLDSTGSSDTPVAIRAIIEAEAAKMQHGSSIDDSEKINTQQLLNSEDTAVVLVEGIVPPGAPKETSFDLHVAALPSTSTTSLAGGRLWTTRLTVGVARAVGPQARSAALAKGEVFINPFAGKTPSSSLGTDPTENASTSVEPRVGRILNGGFTTINQPLIIQLRTASYSRSRAVTNAVNKRFPQEPGQRYATATPLPQQTDERISIVVPPSFIDHPDEFVKILMHTQIYSRDNERAALSLLRWLRNNPLDAPDITWCWIAIGRAAVPVVQQLYNDSEIVLRLAALKSGAILNDPLTVSHLIEIAENPDNQIRLDAIALLGRMEHNIRVSAAMRQLLEDPRADIRLAAYDSMLKTNDPLVRRVPIGRFTGFDLYTVPSDYPMIYVTQQKKPQLTVFGRNLLINRPILVTAWADRFILVGEMDETAEEKKASPLRLYYRDARTNEEFTKEPEPDLIEFIKTLANDAGRNNKGPGLGMVYSEVVSLLHTMYEQKAITAPIVLEQDRILAALMRSRRMEVPTERPISEMNQSTPSNTNDYLESDQLNAPDQETGGTIEPPPTDRPVTNRP